MINITNIKTGLIGVNGWKQSLITDAPVIDADNLATSSGAYYNQDFSALVTVNNIVSVYEQPDLSDEQVNTLLKDIVKGAATKVLNAVFSDDDFIENDVLFPNEYDFTHTLENDISFVGYEIEVAKCKDIVSIINNISLTFDGIDTVKILLFHSSKKSPIKTIEIDTEENNEVSQTLSDWALPHINSVSGGTWYIGYLRSGLTAKAINREYEDSILMNSFSMTSWETFTVIGHDSETLFDVNDIDYTSETYGMNFNISAFKNYDALILQNKNKFSKALGLQVAADVLDMILNTTNSNRIERITNQEIRIELEGFFTGQYQTAGIYKKLTNEINTLKKIFSTPELITYTLK